MTSAHGGTRAENIDARLHEQVLGHDSYRLARSRAHADIAPAPTGSRAVEMIGPGTV